MDSPKGAKASFPFVIVATLLLSPLVSAIAVVVPASGTSEAATVILGTIQAQLADLRGVDNGLTGNCITYSPVGTSTSSTFVSSPNEAITAHGASGSCPLALSTSEQSAVGFFPSSVSSVADAQAFVLGRMVHYDNPVTSNDRFFTGNLNIQLPGFPGSMIALPWTLDETPNDGPSPNDEISFASQISDITLTQGGLAFKLVVRGFTPATSGAACPAVPLVAPQNVFSTIDGADSEACVYAALEPLRSLVIVKSAVGTTPPPRSFGFTSSSALAGSPWSNRSWSLVNGGSIAQSIVAGETLTVTELDPGDDAWSMSDLSCTELNAAGMPQPMRNATFDLNARQVTLPNVPPPLNPSNPAIECTFTNSYAPPARLTLYKRVNSGIAAPSLWTLTATGTSPSAEGTTISGPSGSAAVTSQVVPTGTYQLSEAGTGAAQTGYLQAGPWTCRTAGGTTLAVMNGAVTLPASSSEIPPADVTCTVTNRFGTGALQISKVVHDPFGGYTGGASKTFSGTYDCGPGFTGTYATLTTAVPITISGFPVGRTCTVAENSPTGGLLNASFAWSTPTFSAQPVMITDQGTSQVTVTNQVEQHFGTVAVSKVVTDATGTSIGYAGGTSRVFPVGYSCTLTNGPTTSGSLAVTLPGAVSPAAPIPRGSVCTFNETLTAQLGDFDSGAYSWSGSSITPPSVTIGDGTTTPVTVTNRFTGGSSNLLVTKDVVGDGYVGGTDPNFDVTVDCGGSGLFDVQLADGGSTSIGPIPVGASCSMSEAPPSSALLTGGRTWQPPTWAPGHVVTVAAGSPVNVSLTNSTEPIDGRVSVTKTATGETAGIAGDATFHVDVVCGAETYGFDLALGATATTPDLPVGTSCSVIESTPPGGSLIDSSFAWDAPSYTPAGTVAVPANGTVAVTVENPIVRARSSLTIVKSVVDSYGMVDPAATYTGTYSCIYGNDVPVAGAWSITPSSNDTFEVDDLLASSECTVSEDAPPSSAITNPAWVWAPTVISGPATVAPDGTTRVIVTNSVQRPWAGLQVTKTVVDDSGSGVESGAAFAGLWTCQDGNGALAAGRFAVAAGATTSLFTAADARVAAPATCTVIEDTLSDDTLVDGSFRWGQTTYGPPSATATLVADQTAAITIVDTVERVYSAVAVDKEVTGPVAGQVSSDRLFTGTVSCRYGDNDPIVTGWQATTATSAVLAGVLVDSVCTATEVPPGQGGRPDATDPTYGWASPVVGSPVTVAAPGEPMASIVVTNPTVRSAGTFTVHKSVAGATEGIVVADPVFVMTWACVDAESNSTSGRIEVDGGGSVVVGATPGESILPGSECELIESSGDLPQLIDGAWQWAVPSFTLDDQPATGTGASLSFVIPAQREDASTSHIDIGVANTVVRSFGAYTLSKSSNPVPGSVIEPGSVVTYTLTVESTGTVPVHDVVVTDDLSAVLPNADIVAGSISVPPGTSATFDPDGQNLVWTVGAVPGGATRALTFQIRANPDADGVVIRNIISGDGDVAPTCTQCDVAVTTARTPPDTTIPPTPDTTIPPTPDTTVPPVAVGPTIPSVPDDVTLPATGGSETSIIVVATGIMLAGIVLLVSRRRRSMAWHRSE